jgi:hypothetical protein
MCDGWWFLTRVEVRNSGAEGGGVGERDIDLLSQLVDHAREKTEKKVAVHKCIS